MANDPYKCCTKIHGGKQVTHENVGTNIIYQMRRRDRRG